MKEFRVFLGITLGSFLIFILSWAFAYVVGVNTLTIQSEDTLPALFTPFAVVNEGTLYLDTYYEMMRAKYPHPDDPTFEKDLTPFYLRKIQTEQDTHYISAFPIISGLLAIPVYFLPIMLNATFTWDTLALLGHITGALIVSLSGYVLYKLLKSFYLDQKNSLLLTGIYLFGTINFALISQALWQHGVVQLFTLLALYNLLKSLRQIGTSTHIFLFGFYSSLAILSRPTALLIVPILFLLVLEKYRLRVKPLLRYILIFITGTLPNVMFFIWYNQTYYLSILNQGYASQLGDSWQSRFPEGFLGLWISPSKGLLVYSPILIFALVGFYKVIKEKNLTKNLLYFCSFVIIVLQTLILGKWKHWYGGWSFGYRMASDVLPFFILLLIPFVKSPAFDKFKKLFWVLLILSVFVQLFGIIFFDGIWHAAYDNGFTETSWLWSLQDSELVFNIRRILVKLGYLEKACPNCM